MKVLIIQTAFIGDVVLATPLIEQLYEQGHDVRIDFLLRKSNEELLSHHPKLNQLLIWNKKNQKLINLFKVIRIVRKRKYDLLINLQRFVSTGFITWLSGAKEKIGFEKNPFAFSYDRKILHTIRSGLHEVDRNLKLIEHLGIRGSFKPKLYPPKTAYEKVRAYQKKPYIVIAPTSVWFTKQFPREKWVEFLKALPFRGNIYLIGAPTDREACDWIVEKSSKGTNLCGRLNLIESAALIAGAQMNYVNDSAPMHFASAVNAPTSAIFCSTLPDFGFGPLADQARTIEISEALSCRPCGLHGKKKCPKGHFKCGYGINIIQLLRSMDRQ